MGRNENHRAKETSLAVAQAGTYSASFSLQSWTTFVGAYFPAMDDGDVGIEYSIDNGSNYAPVLDPVDGDNLLVVKSGSDPGWVDISDYLRAIPRGWSNRLLRFTCAAQDPAVTITLSETN